MKAGEKECKGRKIKRKLKYLKFRRNTDEIKTREKKRRGTIEIELTDIKCLSKQIKEIKRRKIEENETKESKKKKKK